MYNFSIAKLEELVYDYLEILFFDIKSIIERIKIIMVQIKGKSIRVWKKLINKFCNKQYIKHLLLITVVTLIAGLILSMLITRSITVNDMVIRYTEPPSEEFDTEGYSGEDETEETPAEADTPAGEEVPPEADTPAGEAAAPEADIPDGEAAPEDAQIPDV